MIKKEFKLDRFIISIYPKPISIGNINRLCYFCSVYDKDNTGENTAPLVDFYMPIDFGLQEEYLKKVKKSAFNLLETLGWINKNGGK